MSRSFASSIASPAYRKLHRNGHPELEKRWFATATAIRAENRCFLYGADQSLASQNAQAGHDPMPLPLALFRAQRPAAAVESAAPLTNSRKRGRGPVSAVMGRALSRLRAEPSARVRDSRA